MHQTVDGRRLEINSISVVEGQGFAQYTIETRADDIALRLEGRYGLFGRFLIAEDERCAAVSPP